MEMIGSAGTFIVKGISNTVLGVVSGLLMTAAFPKLNVNWVAWFALVPLLMALKNLSIGKSFRLGFIAGLVHYLTLLHWLVYTMRDYGNLPGYLAVPVLFLLAAYLALYWGIFSAVISSLQSRHWLLFWSIPIVWVAMEYLREFLLSGFPWAMAGQSQFRWLKIIQISDIFGVFAISFLILMANGAIFLILRAFLEQSAVQRKAITNTARWSSLICIVFLAASWGYGTWRIREMDSLLSEVPFRKMAMIQGNIDQSIKWDPKFQKKSTQKYIDLSLATTDTEPELIIWPETATPFYFTYDVSLTRLVIEGINRTGTDFLIGSPSFSYDKQNIQYFNSAFLIDANGKIAGKYDKVHLVPYGEYVPFKEWFPFLGKMVAQVGDFKAGKKGHTLSWQKDQLGVQICFEIIFADLSRAMTRNGATILVNITNDAWFGTSGAPYQHFNQAVFRAVENRRALVRAANTGISAYIDPVGRVIASTPLFQDKIIVNEIPSITRKSIYTKTGDIFAQGCLVLTLVFSVTAAFSHNRNRKKA